MKVAGLSLGKIKERLWGYLRLIFTLDVLIPFLTLSVGLGMRGSLRYPRPLFSLTPILGVIIALIHPGIIGAAMAGRAFREILSPRILSRFELGGVIAVGMGIPIGVMAYSRAWQPLGVWIIGSGLLFYWHWLSLRAGRQVHILRETVGAVLLVPLPLFFSWTIITGNFSPDREIGLAMLIFGLLALSANLGRAWSEAGRPEPSSGSLFGKATLIIAIFIFSFLLLLLGIHEGVFLPPRMLYLKYGGVIAYVCGLILYYLGLRNMMNKTAKNKLTRYILYSVIPIILLVFWLAYRGRGLAFM